MKQSRIAEGVEFSLRLAAIMSAAVIVAILLFLTYFSAPLFSLDGLQDLLSRPWLPQEGSFGILPMVAGSLLLSILSLILAFPAALCICCFSEGIGPGWLARGIQVLIHFMTSIPTVVYAFVSVFLLIPLLRDFFAHGSGYSLLSATLILSLLILPTIALLIEASWSGMIHDLRLTGSSLGLTALQVLTWIVIPVSKRGLTVAVILGFGRAIGDTLVSLMLAGNAPVFPGSILDPIRTLTAHIAFGLEAETTSPAYHSIFACGLLLVMITSVINLAARRLTGVDHRGIVL